MPELCPEWLALLIIEKACLSSISLYETSGVVCKTGRNFKEKLRELGGLDAVFEITLKCQSDLKKYLEKTAKVEDSYLSTKDVRNDKQLKSLTLLLKCLKIMENVTFLSEDNQERASQDPVGGKVWCYPNVATSFIETLEANELLMVLVGQMYYSGYGVPKDDQKVAENRPLNVPLIAPFTIASSRLEMVENMTIRIELSNGSVGWGEAPILLFVTTED
ncbi:hypothetical protein HN873_004789 [Arachis hypogaea]